MMALWNLAIYDLVMSPRLLDQTTIAKLHPQFIPKSVTLPVGARRSFVCIKADVLRTKR